MPEHYSRPGGPRDAVEHGWPAGSMLSFRIGDRIPPVWVLGFCNFLQGANGAVMLIAVPQLLAARGFAEPRIATVVSIGLLPSVTSFFLSPILDWRFSRRSYSLVLAGLAAVLQFLALIFAGNLALLSVLLFLAYTAVMLYVAATGGWLATLTSTFDKNRLGAWLTVWNVGGGGIVALFATYSLRHMSFAIGALLLSLALLAPLPLLLILPSTLPDRVLAFDSFRLFIRDIGVLLRKPAIGRTILLFILPAASFSLTNSLAGLGVDFAASEELVSLIGGIGIVVAGVVGSLVVPLALNWLRPTAFYLAIGSAGSVFTLLLIFAPRTPRTFALAMLGENAFQAAAFAVEGVIMLRGIGSRDSFAATQFAMLNAASSLPIAYMQFADGQAYGLRGLNGSLAADGLLGLSACIALVGILRRRT